MYILLYAIFSSPLIISFYYSYEKNIFWLLGTLVFLFITSSAILSLSAKIQKRWGAFFLASLPLLLIFLFEIIQLASFYLQGQGFNDRFFFHFTLNTIQEAWAVYPFLTFGIIFILLSFITAIYISTNNRTFKSVPIYLSIIALLISPVMDSAIKDFAYNRFFKSAEFYDTSKFDITKLRALGLNKEAILPKQLAASPGKNLVFIYLESLESIYLEESIFKGLTPRIKRLSEQGLSFTNLYQTPGTVWTIAGMVASQCGTPLLYNDYDLVDGNDIMQNGFLSKAICLGDVLNKAGYIQEYLGGASQRFAGKGDFYKSHHYDEVKGFDELISRLNNKEYKTGWGLYDDSLFEIAAEEYIRLADTKKPFNLTLLTLDTHHPDGHPSHSCKVYPYQDNSILNAVHCTDQLLEKFIKNISRHPSFKDTVVVLSDHLAMRNNAEKFYPDKYQRKLFFSILNTGITGFNNTLGTHMDVAPTILDAIGVKHNASFLAGTNLFEHTPKINHADSFSKERRKVIKYINTKFFSKGDYSLCKGEYLAKSENQQLLKIGNKSVAISFRGVPLTEQQFQKDFAFIAFVDDKGSIKKSSFIPFENLSNILYINRNDIFLIITPKRKLPYGLNYISKQSDGFVSVLFGRLDGSIINLGSFADLQHIQIDGSNCEDLITTKFPPLNFAELCPNDDSQYTASYTRESKFLTIPRVVLPDLMLEVVTFTQETPRSFTLKAFSYLDSPIDSDGYYCLASYANNILDIPSIIINGTTHSLKMKLVSEAPFTLEINEKDLYLSR